MLCAEPRTLYVGGGTPSLMPPEDLQDIVSAVRHVDYGTEWEEFTVEVNPDDISPEYASALRHIGVNRISMGVQSFCNRSLKWMNRRHDAAGAEKAFRILRESGFDNISIDLIFGYDPSFGEFSDSELMDLWIADLKKAMSLQPEHISAYQMGIDDGSTLMEMSESGRYFPPKDEVCAEQYAMLQSIASANGYLQYEVSNFALSGKEAVHNSAYWRRTPYIGLGPAAHSFDGQKRYWNVADIRQYIAYYSEDSESRNAGAESPLQSEVLTSEDVFVENVMLGLRTSTGIPENLPELNADKVSIMLSTGSLVKVRDRLRIPSDKFFISDSIIRSLI